jgi:hypothetical protein
MCRGDDRSVGPTADHAQPSTVPRNRHYAVHLARFRGTAGAPSTSARQVGHGPAEPRQCAAQPERVPRNCSGDRRRPCHDAAPTMHPLTTLPGQICPFYHPVEVANGSIAGAWRSSGSRRQPVPRGPFHGRTGSAEPFGAPDPSAKRSRGTAPVSRPADSGPPGTRVETPSRRHGSAEPSFNLQHTGWATDLPHRRRSAEDQPSPLGKVPQRRHI